MKQPVTINDHADFRRSLADVGKLVSDDDLDDIDAELDLDPLVEKYARGRKAKDASRLISILDELERSGR
jgi:hypothetical protein